MAETVLYLINSTDDSTRIAIQPRTYDGVGGVQRNTSLTLYGNNAPRWGEKFNENFYHLLENFAVDEATSVLPIRPLDETDIGEEGLGLNLPILGQTWYNKSRDAMFVYTSNGLGGFRWTPVTSVGIVSTDAGLSSYASNRTGDLAFSTDTQELKIWNGTTWAVVREAGGGPAALALNDLTDVILGAPSAGQVLKYNGTYWYNGSDNQSAGGGSGTITSISGSGSIQTTPNPITTTGTISLVNDTTSPGASRYYGTNSSGTKGWHPVPTGGGGGGGGVTDHGLLTGLGDDDHPQYLLINGSRAMTGQLNMGNNRVVNMANPVLAQDGATKAYVDAIPNGGALLQAGTVTVDNTFVACPGGYTPSTCYIITSPTNISYGGNAGAGIDVVYSYATVSGNGWIVRSAMSRENSGSLLNITTTYWILKK